MKTFLLLSFFSVSISAAVVVGNYQGIDSNNNPCSFTIGKQWFVDNMRHPFNERIPVTNIVFKNVTLDKSDWNVAHPTSIEYGSGRVVFNHDLFQEIMATKSGGASLILHKNPEESEEGHAPTKIIYINDNYRQKDKSINIECVIQ